MDQEMKLIQVFLGDSSTPAIFEVSSTKEGELICNCPGYRGRRRCKHVSFVQARIDGNGGSYPLEISKRATKEEADLAQTSTELFRDFIIKFGKIEVF